MIRTHPIREQLIDVLDTLMDTMLRQAGSDDAQDALKNMVKASFDRRMDEEIEKYPPEMRSAMRHLARVPSIKNLLIEKIQQEITPDSTRAALRAGFAYMRQQKLLQTTAARGHNRGLEKLLEQDPSVPDSFSPVQWQIVGQPGDIAVLADTCVICLSNDSGQAVSFLRHGIEWNEVYLPISKDRILFGSNSTSPPTLTVRDVNRASAELSRTYLYAPALTDEVRALVPLIGTRASLVEDHEMEEIVVEGWAKIRG